MSAHPHSKNFTMKVKISNLQKDLDSKNDYNFPKKPFQMYVDDLRERFPDGMVPVLYILDTLGDRVALWALQHVEGYDDEILKLGRHFLRRGRKFFKKGYGEACAWPEYAPKNLTKDRLREIAIWSVERLAFLQDSDKGDIFEFNRMIHAEFKYQGEQIRKMLQEIS